MILLRHLILLLLLGCHSNAQSQEDAVEHMNFNIEKMAKAYLDSFPVENSNEESILEINGAKAAKLIQGDIIPSDEDIAEMEERLRASKSDGLAKRPKRGASHKRKRNWPIDKPIPFMIAPGYSDQQKNMIRDALKTFKENTCFEFEESHAPGPKLSYFNNGTCATYMGDTRGGGQHHLISLGEACFTISTIQHETMHALGFGHTMNRHAHVTLTNWCPTLSDPTEINTWISSGKNCRFDWDDFNNHSIPYEYNSVMHYDSRAGSATGKPVVIPKNRDYIRSVGGNHGPTFYDWKAVNVRYGCIGKKCGTQRYCMNGGYPHPRYCDRCACPTFYAGKSCEREVNAAYLKSGVPRHFTFNTPFSNKTKFSNQDLEDFSVFDKELHVIRAPAGRRIRITLNEIDPHKTLKCLRECDWRAVEIVDGDIFCCHNSTGISFVSTTNVIGYQVYSRPGLTFTSNVTFSVEPANVSPTDGPATKPPSIVHETPITREVEEIKYIDEIKYLKPEASEFETELRHTEATESSSSGPVIAKHETPDETPTSRTGEHQTTTINSTAKNGLLDSFDFFESL